jgi:dipeptidyl aminopeptidase/acylaminoacyl peptidase
MRLLLAMLLTPLVLSAQSAPITVEGLLSDPFPTELTAAPNGKAVAWVADSVGSRNVWVAESPGWTARRLTPYTGDDGQELTGLRWLSDGSGVAYARGGDPNRAGELPNPTLAPAGTTQDVWVVSLHGDAPHKLGAGSEPAPGPGGVAFVRKNQIWSALASDTATQLLHTRGEISGLRWSPDGARLAFVSRRGDHSFVGVYDTHTRTLKYLAPGLDVDQDPVWSPDGRSVAFVRRPAVTRTEVFGPKRTGRPWEIWVADAATGDGHAIWTSAEGVGSVFHRLDSNDQLFWTSSGTIVFPWERDGWEHMYAVAASGGEPRLLTPGQFEVEQAILTADHAALLVTSNQNDSPRRHIWRVDPERGAPVEVTHGDGIEWSPVAVASGLAVLHSGARTPARPAFVEGSAAPRDFAPIPASFPAERSLVTPTEVTFPAADGLVLHGQLFLPSNLAQGERRPAVVFFHGGSRRQMLLGFHYMDFYHNMYSINQYLASRGYIVLSVNYRSGIGYGLDFREALDYGATGASEFNDVQGAGLYLRNRADVDPKHIGVYGGSYGGYLTAMALARSSDLFAAGVDYAGVHDWNLEFDALVPGWDVAKDQRARALAFTSSPMADVDRWRSPVLLVQGDDDRNVVFSQTVQLAEDLRARHVHVEEMVFPDETHDLLLYGSWVALGRATAEFFDRQLGGEKKLSERH